MHYALIHKQKSVSHRKSLNNIAGIYIHMQISMVSADLVHSKVLMCCDKGCNHSNIQTHTPQWVDQAKKSWYSLKMNNHIIDKRQRITSHSSSMHKL